MRLIKLYPSLLCASVLGLATIGSGCQSGPGSESSDITDIDHTDVERQAIGNCWLYAVASWSESMHLTATGEEFDISQSYWTYWHWFGEIGSTFGDEIETGGFESTAFQIVRERGLMAETDFIPEDGVAEMSARQSSALAKINEELKNGRLKDSDARRDSALVREVLDEAWGLSEETRAMLDTAFGKAGENTFEDSATADGTKIISASEFAVRYPERKTDPNEATVKDSTLDVAVDDWRTANYPSFGSNLDGQRRSFQIRVQRALHDGAPVIITWDVDFNAMESGEGPLRGSFNLTTLENTGGPGRQGGHMTVLEDYEAVTEEFGELKAGVTLDPTDPTDADKLEAALLPSTEIKFWRIKNSWGALRDDRASAPGFPGYHDLYMEYLNGPIDWCPSVEGTKTEKNCTGETTPFGNVVLPPGY
jgi:hypothetical protein